MTTNRAGDEVHLTTWIGRTESTRDVVACAQLAADEHRRISRAHRCTEARA